MLNEKTTGIVIIATGHPYYGRYAYNLAITIKAIEPVQIALVYNDEAISHLSSEQRAMFDNLIPLPGDFQNGIHAKLYLDQLTPFDKTLYLDADMVWLTKKPSELFKELDGIQFTGITEGNNVQPNNKYYFWAEPKEIMANYNVEKIYQWRSEVLYFEKTKVFKKARELKPEKKLKTIRMFGAHIPDELYFNISTAILGIEPHSFRWSPAYWLRMNNEFMPKPAVLVNDYYLLSAGSNFASPQMKKAYDNQMKNASHKIGVPYLFPLKSKKEWAPGRLKI